MLTVSYTVNIQWAGEQKEGVQILHQVDNLKIWAIAMHGRNESSNFFKTTSDINHLSHLLQSMAGSGPGKLLIVGVHETGLKSANFWVSDPQIQTEVVTLSGIEDVWYKHQIK